MAGDTSDKVVFGSYGHTCSFVAEMNATTAIIGRREFLESALEIDCVHVAKSDTALRMRLRFHQSWYRRYVIGREPGQNSNGIRYGNLLDARSGAEGLNFLNETIFLTASERLDRRSGAIEPDRLLRNMLSSQPMCFNLLAPLKSDLALASKLVAALPGAPSNLEVTEVDFEYAPDKARHLNDASAFDAIIKYKRGDRRGFIGIETKLSEPFSPQTYDFAARYSNWMAEERWWWKSGAEHAFSDPVHNQIWRNHLLVFAMLNQKPSEFDEGLFFIIHHDLDQDCPRAIEAYSEHLTPEGAATLLRYSLGDVIAAWGKVGQTRAVNDWLAQFRLRYLMLDASEPAWVNARGVSKKRRLNLAEKHICC